MSSTLGSSTSTGWNRRSSAGSFSMCWRYSSSVVAPIARSSPRASIGFSMLPASIAPSAAPAPTIVCSSSMNVMISPSLSAISFSTAFSRSSNSPRYFAPGDHRAEVERDQALVLQRARARRRRRSAARAPRRSRSCRRRARRSAPGCSSCGGDSTWIVRRISSSRPITGSSLPARADLGEVAPVLLERLERVLGVRARRRAGGRAPRRAPRARRRASAPPRAGRSAAFVPPWRASPAAGARSRCTRR